MRGVLSSTYRSRGDVGPVAEPGGGSPGGGSTPPGRTALRTAVAGKIHTDGATVAVTLLLDRS